MPRSLPAPGRRSAQFSHLGVILAGRHRLKQRKAEQVAVLPLNTMMERARSMAERQTINNNEAADPAPQIRRAAANIISSPEPSNRRHNRQRTIKTQIRKTN